MSIERFGPVTFGQQWVICFVRRRADEVWDAEGSGPPMVEVIPVPSSMTVSDIGVVWSGMVRAHESLRTTFRLDTTPPTQLVHEAAPVHLDQVELPEPTEAAAADHAAVGDHIVDITVEYPWRAFVGCHQGSPLFLVVAFDHVAADHHGLAVFRPVLEQALATGVVPEVSRQPLDLATEQRADAYTRTATQRWWTEAWAVAETTDLGVSETSTRYGAIMVSEAGLRAARDLAEQLGVSLQAALLGVSCVVSMRLRDRRRTTVALISSNRFEPRWDTVVSSMTAWVPVTVGMSERISIAEVVRGAHRSGIEACLNGAYDPDELCAVLTDVGNTHGPMAFDCQFNFIGDVGYSFPPDSPETTSVRWKLARRQVGYRLCLYMAATPTGLLVNFAASEQYLEPELVRLFPAALEAALVDAAKDCSVSADVVDLTPLRDLPSTVGP